MERYQFGFVLAWLAVGIVPGALGCSLWWALVPAALAVFVMLALIPAERNVRLRLHLRTSRLRTLCVGLLTMSIGIPAGWLASPYHELPKDGSLPLAFGEVEQTRKSEENTAVQIKLEGFTDMEGKRRREAPNVRVLLYLHRAIPAPAPHDRVMFFHNFSPLEDTSNTQGSDYIGYLRTKGVIYTQRLSYEEELMPLRARHDLSYYFDCLRDRFAAAIDASGVGEETAAFLRTLLLGIPDDSSADRRQMLADAGVAHILAISGLHIGIISSLIYLLTAPIVLFGGRRWRLAAMVVLTWLYVALCGMHYPAMRAALMLTAVMAARFFERQASGWNVLCLSLVVILLIEPLAVFDAGLQLSAVCVFALLALGSPLAPKASRGSGILAKGVATIFCTLIIFFCTWPVMAYYFHSLPTMFLPVNLLVLPLLPPYLCFALIFMLFSAFGLTLPFGATILDTCYDALMRLCSLMAADSTLDLWTSVATPLLWLAGIALLAAAIRSASKPTALAGAALLLAAVITIPLLPADTPADGYILRTNPHEIAISVYSNTREHRMSISGEVEDTLSLGGVKTVVTGRETLARLRAQEAGEEVSFPECELLVVTGAYSGPAGLLIEGFTPRAVALHTSVYPQRALRLEEELHEAGIPCINMHRDGALRLLSP